MKILIAQMNSMLGDFAGNFERMVKILRASHADLTVFPECALCGYPPMDLLDYPEFGRMSEAYAQRLATEVPDKAFIFGGVELNRGPGKPFFNSAFVVQDGKIFGVYRKRLLPTYDVFDEDRFFEAGQTPFEFRFQGKRIGLTICEDIWSEDGLLHESSQENAFSSGVTSLANRYDQRPLQDLSGVDLWINISASPFEARKVKGKREMLGRLAKAYQKPFFYVNAVGAHDSLIFDGNSYVFSASGELKVKANDFREDFLTVDLNEVQQLSELKLKDEVHVQVYEALILGIRDYFFKNGFKGAVLGASGGVDSSVVACLAMDALGAENVQLVMMPSRFTSAASNQDALFLARATQCPTHIMPIEEIYQASLRTLSKAFEGLEAGIAEENLQARARGMILMGLSNKFNLLTLTTGNKSELAVGYCTLYGDMCGALAPLSDVYKTDVYHLAHEANRRMMRISESVFKKAPTAELRANQTDQDTLPPYDRLDRMLTEILENFKTRSELIEMKFDPEEIEKVLSWIQMSEHKRFQMPLGLKVSSKAFGIGRRVPMVNRFFAQGAQQKR